MEAFRQQVRSTFGVRLRDLRIFGSKVRGDDHDESDIDLLVLLDGCTSDDWRLVNELAWSISYWLMPTTRDFDGYHSPISRATGFYKEMRRESVRL